MKELARQLGETSIILGGHDWYVNLICNTLDRGRHLYTSAETSHYNSQGRIPQKADLCSGVVPWYTV